MIKKLWNYGIKVENLREVTEFYTRYMGAEVRIQSEVLGCQYVLLRLGETRIILFDKAPYEDDLGLNRITHGHHSRRIKVGEARCGDCGGRE